MQTITSLTEADVNHDGLISYQEFLDQTKRDEFQRDPGWDTVDNIPQYTHEEYLEFERRRHEEIQRLIAEGKVSLRNVCFSCMILSDCSV